MPEPIRSVETNMCLLEEPYEENAPPAAARPASPREAEQPHGSEEPAPNPRAVQQLVSASSVPAPSPACLDQAAEVVKSGGMVLAAGVAVLASGPTLLGIAAASAAFIALSATFGANLAKLENCEDDAAARAKPK